MRVLVISDIHANLTALEAVLDDAGEVDTVWCLGDLVGYGPDPNECIERIQELPKLICLIGNHDAAAIDIIDLSTFNPEARVAALWTQDVLSPSSVEFLNELPERIQFDQVTLVHGSPRHPVWEYLLDTRSATISFNYFRTPYCFVGHSHLPLLYHLSDGKKVAKLFIPDAGKPLVLTPRSVVNPGSVGQPRDRDPRASYAIFDLDMNSWELHRVKYDVLNVQARMVSVGLPERHIERLEIGW